MKQLTVQIPQRPRFSYPIVIGQNLLENLKTWLPLACYEHMVIITDNRVKKYYGFTLLDHLQRQGYKVSLLSFPAGENSKQQQTKQRLEEQMLKKQLGRNTLCIALGGGVVGDMAGFLSATYMRGIDYIQMPTTLLAMVDSSVGGKTAIDTPYGKNLIGAFWQPKAVIADLGCLKSLPTKQLVNGLIEAVKMFLTNDINSVHYVERNLPKLLDGDEKILQQVIHRALKIKAEVVEKDEKEQNLRKVLNFGHTIGHALEQIGNYKMLHGYAVAYGILVEAKISVLLGLLTNSDYLIIKALLVKLGIVGKVLKETPIDKIIQLTKLDKKVRAGQAYYVLLKALGQAYSAKNQWAHPIADKIVKQAFLTVAME